MNTKCQQYQVDWNTSLIFLSIIVIRNKYCPIHYAFCWWNWTVHYVKITLSKCPGDQYRTNNFKGRFWIIKRICWFVYRPQESSLQAWSLSCRRCDWSFTLQKHSPDDSPGSFIFDPWCTERIYQKHNMTFAYFSLHLDTDMAQVVALLPHMTFAYFSLLLDTDMVKVVTFLPPWGTRTRFI